MNSIEEILSKTLTEIIPTEDELKLIDNITNTLRELLKERAIDININYTTIEPQGSTGIKQTQLRGDFDIDLFIGLDYNEFEEKYKGLSKSKLKRESKKDFLRLCNDWIIKSLQNAQFEKPRLLYAEHPYVTVDYLANHNRTKVDIVLYFDLNLDFIKKNGPITAVDRTPYHGRFVRDNLTLDQKNDVRLLKQFFKSQHSYGDKSAVGRIGFIGYSAELLIYHYQNLLNLFSKFHELKNTPLDHFNRSKKQLNKISHFQNDYLIIIDPIDKNRNVGSAISRRAYAFCNHQIQTFLKEPIKKYFEIEEIPLININSNTEHELSHYFIIELVNKDSSVHYTINRDKLYSLGDSIASNAEKEFTRDERFGRIEYELYFENDKNEYNLALYCEKPLISPSFTRRGPPIDQTRHVEKFKHKNSNYFEKDGYLWTETKRDFTSFLNFLQFFLKDGLPSNFQIINVNNALSTQTYSGKKAIYILKNYIMPFL
ncbi:MAG: hypothetical protein GF383_00660 [Candidatus Lokiarchaeota archaeon]|nr:hypothetical protein [Candidatus Lokiarchaeota archaeon]MBD3337684.1 hypothetical protein [Candidatus Lokiarchaeota archaeon]